MAVGNSPTTTTQSALPTNQFPTGAVYDDTSGNMVMWQQAAAASNDLHSNPRAPGAVGIADGLDATQGLTTDAAITGDSTGTISAKLRGLNKIFADVWDSVNHVLKVSVAALPLPTGAATSAKQPALGTAGTASSDVLSVQGIAGMTPLKTDGSAVMQPVNLAEVGGIATQMSTSDGVMPAYIPADAQYLYTSGGPPNSAGVSQQLSMDRLRGLQGKNTANATITSTLAGDTSLSCASGAMASITPGQAVFLYYNLGSGVAEVVYVSASYVPSATAASIPLQTPVVHATLTYVQWSSFSPTIAYDQPMLPDGLLPIVPVVGLTNHSDQYFNLVGLAGDAANSVGMPGVIPGFVGNNGIDRVRNNNDSITLISASGVNSTQTSSDQVNYNWRGLKVYLYVTTIGTGSLIATIQGKDPVSGQYFAMLTSAAITANGFHVLTIYPGIAVAANGAASDVLPRTWNVVVTGANGTSFTVSMAGIV